MASTWHIADLAIEADWVEAWGTWVGGIATAVSLYIAVRAIRNESNRRRDDLKKTKSDERDAQDAQARTVVLHDAGCGGREYLGIDNYQITIGNYGQYPITNVVSELTYKETGTTIAHAIGWDRGGQAPLPVLVADGRQQLSWNTRNWNLPWPGDLRVHQLPDLFDLIVKFTDVHGVRRAVRPGLGQQPYRDYEVGD